VPASINSLLKQEIEGFLTTGDALPILSLLRSNPDVQVPCAHAYPFLHRIQDLVLEGRPYRLLRCATCADRLVLEPSSQEAMESPGVPLWLIGEALLYWARREKNYPSEGPIDWEAIRRAVETTPIAELEANDDRAARESEQWFRRTMGSPEAGPILPFDPLP